MAPIKGRRTNPSHFLDPGRTVILVKSIKGRCLTAHAGLQMYCNVINVDVSNVKIFHCVNKLDDVLLLHLTPKIRAYKSPVLKITHYTVSLKVWGNFQNFLCPQNQEFF
ncbi:hypothetical protein Tcan_00104 [Toxocara canis]|uniref:Uncharacterized protein n=1 Tax=Toxocara canis TaxID=6265 RepID=A0A0B2VJJ3_TOXCA|nr:hypothetical protein Tcan_00104 [Toxocara canis]